MELSIKNLFLLNNLSNRSLAFDRDFIIFLGLLVCSPINGLKLDLEILLTFKIPKFVNRYVITQKVRKRNSSLVTLKNLSSKSLLSTCLKYMSHVNLYFLIIWKVYWLLTANDLVVTERHLKKILYSTHSCSHTFTNSGATISNACISIKFSPFQSYERHQCHALLFAVVVYTALCT